MVNMGWAWAGRQKIHANIHIKDVVLLHYLDPNTQRLIVPSQPESAIRRLPY